jgi:hypothetical protein
LKRKIERKFQKLSAPSQIVAPLRLKHNFLKTYVVPFFFQKIKLEGIFCGSLHRIAAPKGILNIKLKKGYCLSSNFFEK